MNLATAPRIHSAFMFYSEIAGLAPLETLPISRSRRPFGGAKPNGLGPLAGLRLHVAQTEDM